MISFLDVTVGEGARVRCTRCGPVAESGAFRPADEVIGEAGALCAAWGTGTGPNIRLSGAEPFDHPELPRIVSGIVGAGCARLAVDTDAVALRSPSNATGALVAGVRHLRFTLLAGTAGIHDALAGVPGILEATLEGVRTYRAAAASEGTSVCVTASVPVCRHNVRDLPAAVGLAVEVGADRVEVTLTDGGMELGPSVRWLTAACDTGVVNGVWVEVEGAPFCLLPGYDLHLADAVRTRAGAKRAVCGECALDTVCAGAPAGASGDQLAALQPPPFAATLAPRVLRALAGEVVR